MLTELCTESLVGAVETRFVIGKSCFKRVLSESNISLGWPVIFSCHCSLDDIRQFPAIGQSAGIRQLHVVVFSNVDLLLPSIFCLRLGMQQ